NRKRSSMRDRMEVIQKYINLYSNKLLQKCDWQRYTNSWLFLGERNKAIICLLADAAQLVFI
ncbi:MAG: hypothetical protein QXL94_07235, partial [Candidatus Parvarchaeum sp.]